MTESPPRLAERIGAATPPGRDRTVDALRALAILGVVVGHWLVTAFVAVDGGDGLRVASPLKSVPGFIPVSWVLQTLAVFFLVGGYTAAKGYKPGQAWGSWAGRRVTRLLRPVPALLLAWVPAAAALMWAGFSGDTVRVLVKLVLSPLWFLIVYGTLTALTPLLVALWNRAGVPGVVLPVAVTAAIDMSRFAFDGPAWPGWGTVLTGWLVPFYLGIAWANGALAARRTAAAMLLGGTAGTVALVLYGGYPASMVGVPGAEVSNLNPPTLAAVSFGTAQAGLALLVRGPLGRWMRRPRPWAAVALANMSAMTVFLWHQTAMMTVTAGALLVFGALPGLHSLPETSGWALVRLCWLPVFAAVLAVYWAAARGFENPPASRSAGPGG